jgi:hypothetical protein
MTRESVGVTLFLIAAVVAGMMLITPRGTVDALGGVTDPQSAELSRADASDLAPTAARRPAAHVAE